MVPTTMPDHIAQGLTLIPSQMHGAVERYLMQGIPPGSFLTAVLENDLVGSFGRADGENLEAMKGWADFIYNYLPTGCHGSPEVVDDWITSGGWNGRYGAQDAEEPVAAHRPLA